MNAVAKKVDSFLRDNDPNYTLAEAQSFFINYYIDKVRRVIGW